MILQRAADDRSYNPNGSSGIMQRAADDRSWYAPKSAAAQFGGSWMNQPAPTQTSTLAGKSPMGQEPPKFDVLKNVKDTELDPALSKNFADAQASSKRSGTLFDNYMAQFNEAAAAEKGRLATEIGKYDTAASDFKKNLDMARAKEQQGFADDRLLGLRQILGNDERYALGKGPLSAGRSGEEERMLADSFHDTRLKYDQRVREAEGRDIRDSYNALLNTAPLARNATQQYLASLTTPIGLSQSLQAGNTQNLGAAAGAVMQNRFYTPYSDDPRLIPQLPTPSGQYRIPNVPNYGVNNPVRRSGYDFGMQRPGGGGTTGGGTTGGGNGPAPGGGTSAVEHAYYKEFGVYPQYDDNFTPARYNSVGGRTISPSTGYQPSYNPATKTWDDETNQRVDKARLDQQSRHYTPPPGPEQGPPYDPTLNAPQDFYPYNTDSNARTYNSLNENWTRYPGERDNQVDPAKFWQMENERRRLMLPYPGQDQSEFMVPSNAYDPNNLGSGY